MSSLIAEYVERDPRFCEAVAIALEGSHIPHGTLHRRMRISYQRTCQLMDMMIAAGIVSGFKGHRGCEVLMGRERWEEISTCTADAN